MLPCFGEEIVLARSQIDLGLFQLEKMLLQMCHLLFVLLRMNFSTVVASQNVSANLHII